MGSIFKIINLLRYISNMIKRLLVILLLNRVAHSMGIRDEAKSSDVDSYSLYDSIKVSNSEASLINERKRRKVRSPQNSAALGNEVSIEELPSVGVNGGRRYINRLLKTLAPTQAADNLNPDIQEKTTDESLADFLLESVVNIGLVQAKVNTALKNYRADIQKNMLRLPDLLCSNRMVRMKSLPDFPGLNKMKKKMILMMRTLMMKTLMTKMRKMTRKMTRKRMKKMRKMIGLVSSQKGEENFSILTTMMNKFKFYFLTVIKS